MQRRFTLAAGALALLAVLSASGQAAAKNEQWYLGVEGYAGWLREAPTMVLHSDSAPRNLVGLKVPPSSGLGLAGVGADVGVGDDHLVLRLLHVRYAHGFTSYDVAGSTEGTPIDIATGSTNLIEASFLPFDLVGFRGSLSPGFRLQAIADIGIGYAWGSVNVAGAPGAAPATYTFENAYAYVRAELDACGKVGEGRWMCLSLVPNIVEFGSAFPLTAFNGGTLGLRVEL